MSFVCNLRQEHFKLGGVVTRDGQESCKPTLSHLKCRKAHGAHLTVTCSSSSSQRVANRDLAPSINAFHRTGGRAHSLCDVVFCVSSLIIFFPRLEEEEMLMALPCSQSLMLVAAPRRAGTTWVSCVGSLLWKGGREWLGKEELREEDPELPGVSVHCHICSPLCFCYCRKLQHTQEGYLGHSLYNCFVMRG